MIGRGVNRRTVVAIVAAIVAGIVVLVAATKDSGDGAVELGSLRKPFSSNDPLQRACALERDMLVRIQRGYDPIRSEDLTFVPRAPNHIGTFTLTSHSGPWDYLQNVPLVLYGPGRIRAAGKPLDGIVNVADVYPTVGRLLGVGLEPRDGRVLKEALASRRSAGPPKLVVVVVWDGAGRTTLQRWPESWPTLRRLEAEGTSYLDATVGSSPSITSVVHSTLGTGSWPRAHGVTSNVIRTRSGDLQPTFSNLAAAELEQTTFADQIDLALGNEPKVGTLAWRNWHLGMMGHGSALPGADEDEAALLHYEDGMHAQVNPDFYAAPARLLDGLDVTGRIEALDRADGAIDGRWMGHEISVESGDAAWDTYSNPAWAALQADIALRMLSRGGYGRDAVPDLFFTNFKMTDLAGHRWGSDSPESAAVLKAQDEALERIVSYLDEEVGDYAVIVTADHGAAPIAEDSGAWPIGQGELIADIDRHFGIQGRSSLVLESAAFGFHLDRDLMAAEGISTGDVAAFVNSYTIADNWQDEELPPAYAQRGTEQVFSAAFPTALIDRAVRCSFDGAGPPGGFRA